MMENNNNWLKDKTYFLKKYNTEKKMHRYTIEHMTETLKRVVEENTLLKADVEYYKDKAKKENERRKKTQDELKELEHGKTHK